MQVWLKSSIVAVMAAVAAGCASPDDKVVDDDHRYVNAQDRKPVILPDGAQRPKGSDDFVLPEGPYKGVIGEKLDIQAPPQLLALASGSRLDDKNTVNKIWFDRTNVIDDLPKFAFDAMKGFLQQNNVVGSKFDDDKFAVTTGWVNHTKEGGFWLWGGADKTFGYRFKTVQTNSPKRQTSTVEVKLVGYQVNGKDVSLSTVTKEQIARVETAFLNDYIYYYQLLQEDLMKAAQVAKEESVALKLIQNAAGQWVWHSSKDVDTVWVSFRTLLENLGFTVDDVDRTSKKLYVTFAAPEAGFWSSLWSDDDGGPLALPAGKYIVHIADQSGESNIIFLDGKEQPLDKAQYQSMEQTLVNKGRRLKLEL